MKHSDIQVTILSQIQKNLNLKENKTLHEI